MYNVWSSYTRKQSIINKSVPNIEVSELLLLHYKYLHSHLVHTDSDESLFNDTYLKLTYSYNPDKDFIELFTYLFKLLKGEYISDNKVANYYMELVDTDKASMMLDTTPDTSIDTQQSQPDTTALTNLKNKVLNYAISQKSYKRAEKKCKP